MNLRLLIATAITCISLICCNQSDESVADVGSPAPQKPCYCDKNVISLERFAAYTSRNPNILTGEPVGACARIVHSADELTASERVRFSFLRPAFQSIAFKHIL